MTKPIWTALLGAIIFGLLYLATSAGKNPIPIPLWPDPIKPSPLPDSIKNPQPKKPLIPWRK